MGDQLKKGAAAKRTTLRVVILCLLLALIPIGFLDWCRPQRNLTSATDALVNSVATAITTYQVKTWQWNEGTSAEPQMRTYHMFDLNRDGLIDGTPATTTTDTRDGGFSQVAIDAGYHGFIDMAQPQIRKSFINPRGQPIDAWGHPLRIAFAAKVYGTQAFGVWSAGRDGIDGTADDLKSWTPVP